MTYTAYAQHQALDLSGAKGLMMEARTYGGLIRKVDAGLIYVCTSTPAGIVRIDSRILDRTPPEIDETWEDITELSIALDGDGLLLQNIFDDPTDQPEMIMSEGVRGNFRVRLHRRGVGLPDGQLPDGDDDSRLEEVLVALWPDAEPNAPRILRLTSSCASEIQEFSDLVSFNSQQLPDSGPLTEADIRQSAESGVLRLVQWQSEHDGKANS